MASLAWYLSQHHGMVPLLTLYGMFGNPVRKMVSTIWYVPLWHGTTICHIVALVTLWHCSIMACKHYDMVPCTVKTMAQYHCQHYGMVAQE